MESVKKFKSAINRTFAKKGGIIWQGVNDGQLSIYIVLARSLVSLVSGDQPPRLRSSKSGTVYFVLDEVSHVHNTRLRTVLLFSR